MPALTDQPPENAQREPAEVVRAALNEAVSALATSFAPDELAYLAATSKVELPVRDRLAWALHRALGEEFVVSREWRRADLAVLDPNGVIAQLEAKTLYSFDVMSAANRRAYIAHLQADAAKMAALAPSDRYLLSIVVDVDGDIRPDLKPRVVKYSRGIMAGAKLAGDDGARAAARHLWREALEIEFGCRLLEVEIDGGRVWDLDVSVDLFLVGPLTATPAT